MHHIRVPTLRHHTTKLPAAAAALPPCATTSTFEPLGVSPEHWEFAKKRFIQSGGLSGSDQISEFLSRITNSDVMAHEVRALLERLCSVEGHALLRQLDDMTRLALLSSSAASKAKATLSARKFASFRAHSQQVEPGLSARPSVRLTPRRLSQMATPQDEALRGNSFSMAEFPLHLTSEPHVPATNDMRLQFDWYSVHMLEDAVTGVLPLRALSELPSSSLTPSLLNAAARKPTYDWRRDSGGLSMHQFALLLSYFANPDHAPTTSDGKSSRSFASRIADAQNGEHLMRLLEDGYEEKGSTDDRGEMAHNLELIFESFGMPSLPVLGMLGADRGDSETTGIRKCLGALLVPDVTFVNEALQEDGDVLTRLTPPRRSSFVIRSSTSTAVRKSTQQSESRDSAEISVRAATSFQDYSSSLARVPSVYSGDRSLVSLHEGGRTVTSSSNITPARTPRSGMFDASVTNSESMSIRTDRHVEESSSSSPLCLRAVNSDKMHKQMTPVIQPLPEIEKKRHIVTRTQGTQTSGVSFCFLWLGPMVKNASTTTTSSGEVGKVVSIPLLRRDRRRLQRTTQEPHDYSEMTLDQLTELYRSMTKKSTLGKKGHTVCEPT